MLFVDWELMTVLGSSATELFACAATKKFGYAVEEAGVFPLSKVVVGGLPGRKILGEHTPGTARAEKVENAIENDTIGVNTRTSSSLCFRQEGLHDGPLYAIQV